MKISKSFKILLVVFALAIAGVFTSTQNASAKTKWTKGTPTALRGDWRAKQCRQESHLLAGRKPISSGHFSVRIPFLGWYCLLIILIL